MCGDRTRDQKSEKQQKTKHIEHVGQAKTWHLPLRPFESQK